MESNKFLERVDYEAGGNKFQVYLHKKRYQLATKYLSKGNNILLDIGCGFGWGTNSLSSVSKKIIGIDVSEDALRVAKARYKDPIFIKSNAVKLPFRDQSIDAVIALEIIEHIENQKAFMSEVLRVLKQHATLILSTPNKRNLIARVANLFGVEVQKNPYHTREFDYKSLVAFLSSYGLEIIDVFGFYLPLDPPVGRCMVRLIELSGIYKLLVSMGRIATPLARFSFVICRKI